MKGDRDPAPIAVPITAMAPTAPLAQDKSVSKKCPNHLSGSERPDLGKVDRHECRSHRYRDSGTFEHFYVIV
jgi:hypothetical protein